MTNTEQYYPTPESLLKKLLDKMDFRYVNNILDPSAGTGHIAKFIEKEFCRRRSYEIQCIEVNKERQATLRGHGYKVIWDDFLTFNTLFQYSAIVMNPPFADGARHLLKALSICAPGGQIACILNAETLKNHYSMQRQTLLRRLHEQENCSIEYVKGAFEDAEHPADVEIALVYVKKKPSASCCNILGDFKRSIFTKQQNIGSWAMTRCGATNQLLDYYQAEIRAALKLYDEILNYNRLCLQDQKDPYPSEYVFDIKINGFAGSKASDDRNAIVRKLNYKYWKILLYSKELSKLMTNDLHYAYQSRLQEMADFEFNERNILQMKYELSQNLLSSMEEAIMKVWDTFTCRFAWSNYSQTVHFYDGWTTNKAFKCNKKVIIPLNAFNEWSGQLSLDNYQVQRALLDIEKVMNYLDSGRTADFNLGEVLAQAQKDCQTKNIDTKFFTITIYKKGTCHLVFKDLNLLKKFNLYAGRKNHWLPDSYGKKYYQDLTDKERFLVDSFEGKESYEDTVLNHNFYLPESLQLPALSAAS